MGKMTTGFTITVLPPPLRGGKGGGGGPGAGSSGTGGTTIGGGKGLIGGLMGIIGGPGGIGAIGGAGLIIVGPGSGGGGSKICGDRTERCFELLGGEELAVSIEFSSQSIKESSQILTAAAMER